MGEKLVTMNYAVDVSERRNDYRESTEGFCVVDNLERRIDFCESAEMLSNIKILGESWIQLIVVSSSMHASNPDCKWEQLNGANGEVTGTDDMKSTEAVKALAAVYNNPFSTAADGATILDEYQHPVNARKAHVTSTIAPTASGGFSLAFFPGPCLSAFNMESTATFTWGGQSSFVVSTNAKRLMDNTQLYDNFIQYRVVGGGLRIRNLMTPLNATGRLEVVQVPVSKPGVNYQALETLNIGADQMAEWLLGKIPTSSGRFSSFLSMPGADEYTASELDKNDLIIPFKVTGSNYFNFKSTVTDERSSNYLVGDEGQFFDSATGAMIPTSSYASSGVTDCHGMTAICLRGTGFPSGTVLEIEQILHIEGVPFTNSSTAIFASSVPSKKLADPLAQTKLIAAACSKPDSFLVGQLRAHGKNVSRGIKDSLKNRKTNTKSKTRKVTQKVTDAILAAAMSRVGLSRGPRKKASGKGGKRK